jgi:hypothetical protein
MCDISWCQKLGFTGALDAVLRQLVGFSRRLSGVTLPTRTGNRPPSTRQALSPHRHCPHRTACLAAPSAGSQPRSFQTPEPAAPAPLAPANQPQASPRSRTASRPLDPSRRELGPPKSPGSGPCPRAARPETRMAERRNVTRLHGPRPPPLIRPPPCLLLHLRKILRWTSLRQRTLSDIRNSSPIVCCGVP